jgi:hypothetical protein
MSSPKSAAGPTASPRRQAGEALNRGTKAANRGRPDQTPEQEAKRACADAHRIVAAIEHGIADGRLDVVSADVLQALIAAASRLYAARREAGEDFTPVARNAVSATDVMVTASALLRAADLAAFELGVWQGCTGR